MCKTIEYEKLLGKIVRIRIHRYKDTEIDIEPLGSNRLTHKRMRQTEVEMRTAFGVLAEICEIAGCDFNAVLDAVNRTAKKEK